MYDIRYDIIHETYDVLTNLSCLAAVDRPQAQPAEASDADHDPDRSMDNYEERDFADQGPLTDMDMEEDAEFLALLLKHMPSCIDAADIEQLVRDIPDQPPVAGQHHAASRSAYAL